MITGDTIPDIVGDTLNYTLHSNEKLDLVTASLDGSILTLEAGSVFGTSNIQLIASAGFTKRMDHLTICYKDTTTGIKVISADDQIRIYPNPTNLLLTIETDYPDCYSIDIHSLKGQLIYQEEMEGNSKLIDMTPFSKGVYFITVRSEEFVRTEKIVKM